MIFASAASSGVPGTPPVGILGGGQLGCMLADAAIALGLKPRIYAETGAPAFTLHPTLCTVGSPQDEGRLKNFFEGLSVVAFENEFLDTDLLRQAGPSTVFGPDLSVIRRIQDKLMQKEILADLSLPTAPYLVFESSFGSNEIAAQIEEAFSRFADGVVFKWSRLGYDGKGVLLAGGGTKPRLSTPEILKFIKGALDQKIPVYAEAMIPFQRELAIVACRSTTGDLNTYPLVISEQERGICLRVKGPATAVGIPIATQARAQEFAKKLADGVGMTGTFALEFFETRQGELLINEIAPRVHNTGHYTQDACPVSQFENHWRALLGFPLGSTTHTPAFAMLNLIGPEHVVQEVSPHWRPSISGALKHVRLHWYAKSQIKPHRKLGHLNATASDEKDLARIERELNDCHQAWISSLSTKGNS